MSAEGAWIHLSSVIRLNGVTLPSEALTAKRSLIGNAQSSEHILIEVASIEMRLRRLLAEIRKTTIRINSLDVVLLPRLTATLDYIEWLLSEREREHAFRLKRVKEALAKKHSSSR